VDEKPTTIHWKGDHPYFLLIRQYESWDEKVEMARDDGSKYRKNIKRYRRKLNQVIDLNEKGWAQTFDHLLRIEGTWMLCSKEKTVEAGIPVPMLMMDLYPGEQGFCASRVVSLIYIAGEGNQEGPKVRAYGLGKKRYDGIDESVWLFPNGMVVAGDQMRTISDKMNKGYL
jgi:hypothetical protein